MARGVNWAGRQLLEREVRGRSLGPPGVLASHLAGWQKQLSFSSGLCVCRPGWWEGVLFKDYHLIFIFGCGWAC